MSDRQLLEDAAKAAGLRLTWGEKHKVGEDEIDCTDLPYVLGESPDVGPAYWNPLEDDGDALRLAVKLKMQIWRNTGGTVSGMPPSAGFWDRLREPLEPDPYAATRRAIVRAAAAISSQNRGVE